MKSLEAKLSILHSDNTTETYHLNLEIDMAQIQCLLNAHKKLTRKPIFAMYIQKPNELPVEVTTLYDIHVPNM